MKKNGFTLIELLAVIVILAIISVIAIPIILNVVETSKKGAAESSAYGYLDAVEKYATLNQIDNIKYQYNIKNDTYNVVDEVNSVPGLNSFIDMKGEKPTSGEVTLNKKGKVTYAELVINGYAIVCDNDICNVTGKAVESSPYGLFDENGKLVVSYDKLVSQYHLDIEKDYVGTTTADNYYKKEGSGSMYDVLTNNPSLANAKKLVIPDTITKIGEYAFSYSTLEQVIIPDSVTVMSKGAFSNSKELYSVVLSNNIQVIRQNTFNGCNKLTNITIPNSVKGIYSYAFANTNIENLIISDSITYIDYYAFYNCKNLKTVSIGKNLSSYGSSVAFAGCENLETIVVDDDNQYFDSRDNSNAIIRTSTNELIDGSINTVIPNTVTKIGKRAFDSRKITSISIPSSVTLIDDDAFYGTLLTSVTFENTSNWRKCNSNSCQTGYIDVTNPTNNSNLLKSGSSINLKKE